MLPLSRCLDRHDFSRINLSVRRQCDTKNAFLSRNIFPISLRIHGRVISTHFNKHSMCLTCRRVRDDAIDDDEDDVDAVSVRSRDRPLSITFSEYVAPVRSLGTKKPSRKSQATKHRDKLRTPYRRIRAISARTHTPCHHASRLTSAVVT